MSKQCILVENLTKRYELAPAASEENFRERFTRSFKCLVRRGLAEKPQQVSALCNVSFNVIEGEVLGIIGKNGSGKSTLLKILSRITAPTSGSVKIRGRVASLLEVGTGFHGDLSGRENIFLNGAILGMRRHEIVQAFDEIVAFSGVEQFLDTPIKRYSSGMRLRLAFSVAAHLRSDILIIDEVLAVGDHEFQQKCLNVMGSLSSSGRTVLFVSHNFGTVRKLCKSAMLLSKGVLVAQGSVNQVLDQYLLQGHQSRSQRIWQAFEAPQDDVVILRSMTITNTDGVVKEVFSVQEPVNVVVTYGIRKGGHQISLLLHVYNAEGSLLFMTIETAQTCWNNTDRLVGEYASTCTIPANLLNNGEIYLSLTVLQMDVGIRFVEHNVLTFGVTDDIQMLGSRGNFKWDWPPAAVRPALVWQINQS